MLVQAVEAEPPLAASAALVAKVSRLLLLAVCVGPIAVFPIGLVYKGYTHFFGAHASADARPMATDALRLTAGTSTPADPQRLRCRLYFGCAPLQRASVESARD